MVHEIALEPALVATWTSRVHQAHLRESMGLGNPRVVSGFPNIAAWRKAVLEAAGALEPIEQARFEAFVQELSLSSTLRKGVKFDLTADWDTNAVAEHRRRPFDGIICRQPKSAEASTEDVVWDNIAPWRAERGCAAPRQSHEYARVLGPMLRIASKITLVDPHFSPFQERFVATLEALLLAATNYRRTDCPTIAAALLTTDMSTAADFQTMAQRLPQGLRLKVIRYEAREEKDHNRYVFTEFGGVSFGTGLDQGSSRETDDIQLLPVGTLALRDRQYVQRTEGFHSEHVTTVVGIARPQR